MIYQVKNFYVTHIYQKDKERCRLDCAQLTGQMAMENRIDKSNLNPVQQAAIELIQDDMRFLYSLVINRKRIMPTYWIELSPYIGLIVDGAEDWIKSYNNSSKSKIDIPLFNDEQKRYYETMRSATKTWGYRLEELYELLNERYLESDAYFGGLCKKMAKHLHLYDTMGVFYIDDYHSGNTILDACYIPDYDLNTSNGEYIREMAEFAGRYISLFGIQNEYTVQNQKYYYKDYGGLIKIPFGDDFSIKHVLFSCLCIINFALHGIEEIITDEVSTKLRMEYICYYYMKNMLGQIRDDYNIDFSMSDLYISQGFRNSLAHYKLGVVLKREELILSDPLKGLTQKIFQKDYYAVKETVLSELANTANKIEVYLGLRKR